MPDAAFDPDVTPPQPGPTRKQRRLSDHILIAFHSACDQGEPLPPLPKGFTWVLMEKW